MPRSIFINIEPLRFIHLSNDRETISIVSFAWTSSLLIVSLSLSLFFGFQITRAKKKFIKENIAQRLEIFNLFHYHHGIIFIALNWYGSEKFSSPLVNRIFRALCSNKGIPLFSIPASTIFR